MQLREWQNQFQSIVLTGVDQPALQLRSGSIERGQQLAVYANAYRLRLTEALRCNYAMLHQLLGDDDFDAMAEQFIEQHPPRAASIRWFGDQLAGFLARTPPFNDVPAIAELAQFEWALRHAIDAADADRVELSFLQQTPPEHWDTLVFDLHPSLTELTLDWNTPQIWQALNDEQEPPQPGAAPRQWLVYRAPSLTTQWRSALDHESAALAVWRSGGNFGDLCDALHGLTGEAEQAALQAATFLKTWIEQGLLVMRY